MIIMTRDEELRSMTGDPFEMHENDEEDSRSITKSLGLSIIEPPMKMRKEGGNLIVEIGILDVREDEISIALRKEKISVSAEKMEIRYEKEEGYFSSHSMLKYYKISEALPVRIAPEKARISYENGILRIEAPLDEDGGNRIEMLMRKGGE